MFKYLQNIKLTSLLLASIQQEKRNKRKQIITGQQPHEAIGQNSKWL
jgi:hypothetical protein